MCGVTGFLDTGRLRAEAMTPLVSRMADTLSHRGPDDHGVWVDGECGVALGHRRLSVIDLSEAGKQPMISMGGRYIVTYNGEIYNLAEIRKQLSAEGVGFRGHSDTELLLAAVERWGLRPALSKLNGMFAFALWDRTEKRLHLVRDRLGEKPLFYGWAGKTFLFGSELKALRAHPDFRGQINQDALALYFRHNCVPSPHCVYVGFYKLPPGTILTVPQTAVPKPVPEAYWSARETAETGSDNPSTGSERELTDQLEELLADAVRLRIHADVPLGAFLSGGIDSSVVVALMQAQSDDPVKTFTIGFEDRDYDESSFAAGVARHLGTEHVTLTATPADAMAVIPLLPQLYDEPFSDSSQIPTFLVSQLARQQVTVSLSGDGGDELFGGYNRYSWAPGIWRKIGWAPLAARTALATLVKKASPETWDSLFRHAGPALPSRFRVRNAGNKVHKAAGVLGSSGLEHMYLQLASHWQEPAAVVLGAVEARSAVNDPAQWPRLRDPIEWMMYLDLVTYLPDDILVKVDRASMGVSLEARVPMLDHRLVEFAWRVPMSMKVRGGEGKWLLREVLHRYVPRQLVDRPKAGFGLPLGDWLRGPLRDWAESLLSGERLRGEGHLDAPLVRRVWDAHLDGAQNFQENLWDVLMFQAWLEQQ